jgi:hypothetical protein
MRGAAGVGKEGEGARSGRGRGRRAAGAPGARGGMQEPRARGGDMTSQDDVACCGLREVP